MPEPTWTPQREQEIVTMKQALPFRIAYGALSPDGTEFICSAAYTMHRPNRLAREGWSVRVIK